MVLAALLLICSIPQVDDAAKVANDSPAVAADSAAKDASAPVALPSAPAPKVKADPEPIVPNAAALPFQPVKPAFTRPRATPRQRIMRYGLMAARDAGPTLDAWSTRRAISCGDAQEPNPLLSSFD